MGSALREDRDPGCRAHIVFRDKGDGRFAWGLAAEIRRDGL